MHVKCTFLWLWVGGLSLLLPTALFGEDCVNESRTISGTPQSQTERFDFVLSKDDPYPNFELTIHMSKGRADLRILNPAGLQLETVGARDATLALQPIPSAATPGKYTLEVTTSDAVGSWHLRVCGGTSPPAVFPNPGLVSAAAMMLVAIGSVWLWRRSTDESWRWLWVGAGLWTVAVAVKFAIAIPLNKPLLDGLKSSLPQWGYITLGSIYGGAMTGITEVLFTFIAALVWRQMTATASRAVGVGVGAGAFEAAMLAILVAAQAFLGGAPVASWSLVLVPAVERLIAIPCHIAARVLVLMAVARRQWILFWFGFLLLSGTDAVATYMYLTGDVNSMSPWVLEAMIAPFGLLSIPITIWCIGHWPHVPRPANNSTAVPNEAAMLPR